MLSNKDYYAPVIDDKDLFEETKEKFDAATTNQNPQEAASTSANAEAGTDEAEGTDGVQHAWQCIASASSALWKLYDLLTSASDLSLMQCCCCIVPCFFSKRRNLLVQTQACHSVI